MMPVVCVCAVLCIAFWFCVVSADPIGRAVKGVGLRPLACWGCGFESIGGHGACRL